MTTPPSAPRAMPQPTPVDAVNAAWNTLAALYGGSEVAAMEDRITVVGHAFDLLDKLADAVGKSRAPAPVTPPQGAPPHEAIRCTTCGKWHSGFDLSDKATTLCSDCATTVSAGGRIMEAPLGASPDRKLAKQWDWLSHRMGASSVTVWEALGLNPNRATLTEAVEDAMAREEL